MGAFKSSQTFHAPVSLIPGIADEIGVVFSGEGYEVNTNALMGGRYDISITKGNLFKAVLGMKTALKVDIHPQGNAIHIEAGVGIFGQQAIPTVISMFVTWPVLITQIWGMVQQAKLDDRVIAIAGDYIARKSQEPGSPASTGTASAGTFCTSCGKAQPVEANFCGNCGVKL